VKHRDFAKLLQDWRRRNNYSQRDAGLALGCSKRTLQNWEQERAMPQGFGLNAILAIIREPTRAPKKRSQSGLTEAPLETHLL
jgi:DNA-binding transcriptional regulator YiaG